jgi:hypothetical protein
MSVEGLVRKSSSILLPELQHSSSSDHESSDDDGDLHRD